MYIDLSSRFRVIKPEGKGFPYCYSLFIRGPQTVVIDPGAGPYHLEKAGALEADLVLLSHFHFDHLNGYHLFHRAQYMAGEEEREVYRDPNIHLHHHGYDCWEELMGSERPVYTTVAPPVAGSGIRPGFHPIPLAGTFHNEFKFDLGGLTLVALAAPGHTQGHYIFYAPEEQLLYASDLDLSRMGPWYGNTFSSVGDFLASLEMAKKIPFTTYVSGHRKPLDRQAALAGLDQYRDILLSRTERIYELLERPQSLRELAEHCVTIPRHENEYHLFWEMMMVEKHLDYLEQEGQICREGNTFSQK